MNNFVIDKVPVESPSSPLLSFSFNGTNMTVYIIWWFPVSEKNVYFGKGETLKSVQHLTHNDAAMSESRICSAGGWGSEFRGVER